MVSEGKRTSKRGIRPVRYRTVLDLLTAEEAEAIHQASLDILENVGVKMPLPDALDVLGQCGADVDGRTWRVCFPPEMVMSALASAPRSYTLCAPNPDHDLLLDGNHGYLSLDGSGLQIVDPQSGELRRSTFKDLENAVRVADYLEAISFLWPVISAQDCPQEKQPLYELLAMLKNSTKHAQAMTAVDPGAARSSVEIAAAVAGGKKALRRRPLISNFQCSISPLAYDPEGLAAAMIFADAGIPTGFLTMQVGCSTAPATLAGSLAQANAEILAGITFLQSYCPGCPTFYGSCATVMELRSGAVASGGPEDFLLQALSAQMARYYHLPASVGTFATGAKASNWHAGVENAVSGAVSMFAGADMMCGAGLLAGAVIFSYVQLLLDCEIYEIVRRTAEGIAVDQETLALETIKRVGPDDHFMVEPHTLVHMRELWQPMVINRNPYGRYQAEGFLEAEDKAREEACRILVEHHPEPLDKKLQDEIIAIIELSA